MMTAPKRVAVGALSATLVPGGLRDIAAAGEVVFRGIGFVVRDTYWGTYPLEASSDVTARGDTIEVTWSGHLAASAGDLRWTARFTLSPVGVDAVCDARAAGLFETNRTGLVVLHGLAATRGRVARGVDARGDVTGAAFPETIRPHQSFRELASLHYVTAGGTAIDLHFDGETFGTEDQRNWTDASFKTYGRPLDKPVPYRIRHRAPIHQAVRARLGIGGGGVPLSNLPHVRATAALPDLHPPGPATAPGPYADFNRADAPSAGCICAWSASPTVHASDDDTLGESIEALPDLIATTRARVPSPRIRIWPVRLESQFGLTPPPRDRRRGSLVEAAWVLGTIAGLLDDAVEYVGFDAPTGAGAALLNLLQSIRGPVESIAWPDAPRLRALRFRTLPDCQELLVAHAAAADCTPVLPEGDWARVFWLSATGFAPGRPLDRPFTVSGFAVARLTSR